MKRAGKRGREARGGRHIRCARATPAPVAPYPTSVPHIRSSIPDLSPAAGSRTIGGGRTHSALRFPPTASSSSSSSSPSTRSPPAAAPPAAAPGRSLGVSSTWKSGWCLFTGTPIIPHSGPGFA
eukprot:3446460-Rhodomonas_salina.1